MSVSGESDFLSMISGGGSGRRTSPARKPAPNNPIIANRGGAKRTLRKRRAHLLQNLRLVQKCQRRRSTFEPHSAQKFGLYTRGSGSFEGHQPDCRSKRVGVDSLNRCDGALPFFLFALKFARELLPLPLLRFPLSKRTKMREDKSFIHT